MADTTVFERLRDACADDWRAYTGHAFVRAVADGSLPEECFRHYLGQDYLFLIHFARAYALAVYKSDSLEDMRQAAAGMASILDEMSLHVKYCQKWGIPHDEMQALPEATATVAYTRFVLERGVAGDLLDLHVALAPCVVGYAEIGRQIMADPALRLDENPYADWIETYSGAEYQRVAADEIAQIERLHRQRGTEGRWPALVDTFRTATRLEAAFWEMGMTRSL